MDGDAPLAPGHPHLLPAVGALEVAVLPVVGPGAEGAPPAQRRPDGLEEPGVLRPAAVQVPGQGAVQAGDHQDQRQQLKNQHPGEQEHHIENHIQGDEQQVQLVAPVAPGHKAGHIAADHGRSPPRETGFRDFE